MLKNRKKSKDRNCSIIVFWLIVLGLTWITYYKNFLLLKSDNLDIFTVLTLVIAVLTMYGIYLGFLQFIISYINKENEQNLKELIAKHRRGELKYYTLDDIIAETDAIIEGKI